MAKQIPTVGDHVIFTPAVNDVKCRNNYASAIPGIVTQSFGGNYANMTVFPDGLAPEFKSSVQHKSEAQTGQEYWQWPYEYNRN